MLPRLGASKWVTRWLVATLVVSIVAALDGGHVASWLALAPARIVRGEVWRLATWPLVELGPLSLVLTCVSIYKFGGELAMRWGDRRLVRFVRDVVLGAAAATCLLALVAGHASLRRHGGWAISEALVIAWARQFPGATLVLYGVLRMHGRNLVALTLGVAALTAIYYGPVATAPEWVACALAAVYPRARLRG